MWWNTEHGIGNIIRLCSIFFNYNLTFSKILRFLNSKKFKSMILCQWKPNLFSIRPHVVGGFFFFQKWLLFIVWEKFVVRKITRIEKKLTCQRFFLFWNSLSRLVVTIMRQTLFFLFVSTSPLSICAPICLWRKHEFINNNGFTLTTIIKFYLWFFFLNNKNELLGSFVVAFCYFFSFVEGWEK